MKSFFNHLLLLLTVYSCSSQKNAIPNRAYHYTTVRYNGYFHGNEAYKEALRGIDENFKDDYTQILSIFKIGDEQLQQQYNTQFNRAIKKSAKMIDKHSMVFKINKETIERNNMIDDCYLLMAKSQFYLRDFEGAEKTIKYLMTNFPENKTNYQAQIFLLHSYFEAGNMIDFETKKNIIEDKQSKIHNKLLVRYQCIRAQYYIDRKEYHQAIELLEKTIPLIKNKKNSYRIKFIIGQLYGTIGNNLKAAEYFEIVGKKSLNFELAFNANLNYALAFRQSKQKVLTLLNKMIKDKKNKEYLDQIYYVKGKVHREHMEETLAIESFKKSARLSVNNPKQKALSYLELGEHYFKTKTYQTAYTFYDSCLQTLPKDFPNYDDIQTKTSSLSELVENLAIINLQDSLLVLAALDPITRMERIEDLIEKIKVEETELQEKEALEMQIASQQSTAAFALNTGGSTWIFDNPQQLNKAYTDFIKIWGTRKLEDNWRRSKKDEKGFEVMEGDVAPSMDSDLNVPDHHTVEFYLSQIPDNPEEIKAVKEILKKAIYKTAEIYKFKFKDYPEANKYFSRYATEFADDEIAVVAKYHLFRSHNELGNILESGKIKEDILSNHANSKYAELVKNPDKAQQDELLKSKMNEYYMRLFTTYQNGAYDQVIKEVLKLNKNNPNNPLTGELLLLKAFAVGKLEGRNAFEEELIQLQTQYDDQSIGFKATDILKQIQNTKQMLMQMEFQSLTASKAFKSDKSEEHYYVVIYNMDIVNSQELEQKIALFNQQNYGGKTSSMELSNFNDDELILVIKGLENGQFAIQYEAHLKGEILKQHPNLGNRHFPITKSNFVKLQEFKEVEQYFKFFKNDYF